MADEFFLKEQIPKIPVAFTISNILISEGRQTCQGLNVSLKLFLFGPDPPLNFLTQKSLYLQ